MTRVSDPPIPNASRSALARVRMRTGSMGCGGSRSATIEPRYYESRDTESTWLTDTETQKSGNGTGDTENDNTGAAPSGQREEKAVTVSREKKLVNAGTQCSRNTGGPRRAEVRSKSKKSVTEGVRSDPLTLR